MRIIRKMLIIILTAVGSGILLSNDVVKQRAPLCSKHFLALPLGAIRAEGWLEEQLIP